MGIRFVTFQRAPCTGLLPWIPLLAASVYPEETPLFRKELTGETHKAEGERRWGEEKEWETWGWWWWRSSGTQPGYTVYPWGENAAKARNGGKRERGDEVEGVRWNISIVQRAPSLTLIWKTYSWEASLDYWDTQLEVRRGWVMPRH